LPNFKIAVRNDSKMRLFIRPGLIAALFLSLAFTATTANADPLSFSNVVALQNNGNTMVDLFSNPGTTLFGSSLSFLVDVSGVLPAGGTDTLRITYTDAGGAVFSQDFAIPLFGTVNPPFTIVFTVASPTPSIQGVLATLTVDLLSSSPDFIIPGGPDAGQGVDSYTYSFKVAEPVPEPATILLLGAGLVGWATRSRVRKK
jgi:hypothetical protein